MVEVAELAGDKKYLVSQFCVNAYNIIHTNIRKCKVIIIQTRGSKLMIGTSHSTKPYGFRPDYYDSDREDNNEELEKLVKRSEGDIVNLWDDIKKDRPNTKIKTFNIFYNGKDSKINICENRIGNLAIGKCRLFKEWLVEPET